MLINLNNHTFGTVAARKPVISATVAGATRSLNETESGSLILLDRAAGCVVTLPVFTVPGVYFDFMVPTTVTSNSYKIITGAGTELLVGDLTNDDVDTSNATILWPAEVASSFIAITMNGTTTGGLIGTRVRVTSLNSTKWMIEGNIKGNGTVATPLATS